MLHQDWFMPVNSAQMVLRSSATAYLHRHNTKLGLEQKGLQLIAAISAERHFTPFGHPGSDPDVLAAKTAPHRRED